MAKTKRSAHKERAYPETTPPLPDDQPSKIENIISVILGLAVVLVIGAMIVNTIKNRQNPEQLATTENLQVTPTPASYTVEPGDTLWSIAEKAYNDGYKWPEIQKANNITDPENVEEGTKLIIPSLVTGQEEVAVVISGTPVPSQEPSQIPTVAVDLQSPSATSEATGSTGPTGGLEEAGQTLSTSTDTEYTVASGDCLWSIAQAKLGDPYRWGEIANANNLSNPDLIFAGNVLAMPK